MMIASPELLAARHPDYPPRPYPPITTARLLARLSCPHAWITADEQTEIRTRVEAARTAEDRAALIADVREKWAGEASYRDDVRRVQSFTALWLALRVWAAQHE